MKFKALYPAILLFAVTACASYESGPITMQNRTQDAPLSGQFTLPQTVAPPPEIQSLQLHPQGNETAPPIIKLGSLPLVLEFDYIGSDARQFKLSISHHGIDWEESLIGPNAYLGSFYETTFSGGKKSFVQNPSYQHYSYRFPNDRIQITKSGNYLLSIYDYSNDTLLFRIPFFVTENAGALDTRIQRLFTQRKDGRTVAQPFSEYRYPGFVQQPQFDLSFVHVQNQFWGRGRQTDQFSTASPGEVQFHLGREQSFIADHTFRVLDLRSLEPDGRPIVEIQPGQTPPIITLRRDVQHFIKNPSRDLGPVAGIPLKERQAQYGNIIFSLETDTLTSPRDKIYLVGDFNNWMIGKRYRMRYDSSRQLWKGNALIKQGMYTYKYVKLKDNEIHDLALERGLTNQKQSYLTFVYYLDPQRRFYRLLKVDRLISN